MKKLKILVIITAVIVLLICVHSFLQGNNVFKGKFENDAIAWYFLAKGLFCSLSLYLSVKILESLQQKNK